MIDVSLSWNRRRFLALLGAAPALLAGGRAARAVAVDDPVIPEVERYLNGIGSFQARFIQIAPNGSRAEGELYVRRPGQLRLDYAPPSKILLLAPGDWRLIFYDGSVRQVNVLPIARTPLGILLDDPLRLSGAVEVIDVSRTPEEVTVRVQRPDSRDQGSVALVFRRHPLKLLRWSVVDPQAKTTHVVLGDLKTNVELSADLFRWRDPKVYGWPDE